MIPKKITYIGVVSLLVLFLCGTTALGSEEMTATRSISDTSVDAGDTFTVTVEVYFEEMVKAPAIQENLPEGWIISEVDYNDAVFKEDIITWVWTEDEDQGETKTLVYNIKVPESASSGTYSVYGTVTALNSNNENVGTTITGHQAVNVIQSSQSSDTTSSSSGGSSSGGGGGGGGGSTGEAYENILKKEVENVYINKDSTIKYEFEAAENAIDYVQFKALKNSGQISTTIEVLEDRSTFADSDAPGLVYQNMNIWVGKVGFATSDNIEDPLVGFSVEKSWMEENEVTSGEISLYRYSDDVWNELETTVLSEDDTYVYFESSTSGFSPFSISASIAEVTESMTLSEDTEELASTSDNTEEEPVAEQEETQSTPGVGLVGTLFMVIVVGVFTAMKGRR